MKTPKKVNKENLIQTRVDLREMQEIITKAHLYHEGSISRLVRDALATYRPVKRVKVTK